MRSSIAFSLLLTTALAAEPGVSILVLRPGQPAEYRVTAPATAQTNYRLASVTKHMTAAAVLSLVDAGKLTLEAPVASFWPEFPQALTVRHLLQHQSGLADYEDHLPPGQAQVHDEEVLGILRKHSTLRFAPGSKFEYSNSGYVLLAQLVQKVSGQRFADYLARTFFRPLRMDCLAHEEGRSRVPQRALGQPKDQSRTSATLGDGGVYCSLDGMAKWLRSRYALDPRMLEPSLGDYGMGWFVKAERVWHTGTTTGFRNAVLVDRATGVMVVVLANRSDVDALKIAEEVLRGGSGGAAN